MATLFTWGVTALGASLVLFLQNNKQKSSEFNAGFCCRVMIAASYWSLLAPAIEMEKDSQYPWLPAVTGFLAGGAFILLIDKILPHLHSRLSIDKSEGIKTSWDRSILLVLAITLHNIPEGLAIGVAFGALTNNPDMGVLSGAVVLAIGIGLQNFPEGTAVSVPLRREGLSSEKSIFLRTIIRNGRTTGRCTWSLSRCYYYSFTPICPIVCCRCYDICSCGGIDT
jgi:ZIP family zinc transporter